MACPTSFDHLPIIHSSIHLNRYGFCVICNRCNIIADTRGICSKCFNNNLLLISPSTPFERLPFIVSYGDLKRYGICVNCRFCHKIVDARGLCSKCINIPPNLQDPTLRKVSDYDCH